MCYCRSQCLALSGATPAHVVKWIEGDAPQAVNNPRS